MRRLALTGALLMLCTNTATGCRQQEKQEVTPEVLMDAVDKNMKEVNSASSSLEIEVELEDVLDHTRIRMDMDMENTVSPRAGHAKGRAEVKLNDNLVSSNMEIYQVEEGDKYVTYSSLYEQWSRTESENSPSSSGTETDFFQSARAEIEDFTLAKQPVKVREKTCYEIYGDMQGKKLMDFLGEEMIQAYGLVDLPDQDALDTLEIPVTVDIYKKEKLPARIIVDMTEIMDELYQSYGKTTNVNFYNIELVYQGYDDVKPIQVPESVKQVVNGYECSNNRINHIQRRKSMFLFRKKEMDIAAAKQFWKWFVENEQWIIDNVSSNGVEVVWAIDAQIKPVFPYFKKELEFQLGFNHGIGEFFFFHFGNKNLISDAQKLDELMPESLREKWSFIIEK